MTTSQRKVYTGVSMAVADTDGEWLGASDERGTTSPFPPSRREEYEHNVLEEVICQLRFPPILKIGTAAPAEFQDRIRERFPMYREQQPGGMNLPSDIPQEVSNMVAQLNVPELFGVTGSKQHRFSTSDEKRSIVLVPNFLAVAESNYERWTLLREEIRFVEQEFVRVYSPDSYSRIGLRYRDKIIRSVLGLQDVEWQELLNTDLTGFLGDPSISSLIRSSRSEVELSVPEVPGALLRLRHGLIPDKDTQEISYVIDSDLYLAERSEIERVYEVLDQFNRILGNLFRWAIRDPLRRALGPRDLGEE